MVRFSDPAASALDARRDRQERRIEALETAAAAQLVRVAVLEVQVADLQRRADRAWQVAQAVAVVAPVLTTSAAIQLALR